MGEDLGVLETATWLVAVALRAGGSDCADLTFCKSVACCDCAKDVAAVGFCRGSCSATFVASHSSHQQKKLRNFSVANSEKDVAAAAS